MNCALLFITTYKIQLTREGTFVHKMEKIKAPVITIHNNAERKVDDFQIFIQRRNNTDGKSLENKSSYTIFKFFPWG